MKNTAFVVAGFATATVIAAFVAFAAPGTDVKAGAATAGKGDSLPLQKFGPSCSQEAWPFYESDCVRDYRQAAGQAAKVRFISFDRL
jgi:hypothetical protein